MEIKYSIYIFVCLIGLNACFFQQETSKLIEVEFSGISSPEFVVSNAVRLSTRDDALLDRFYSLKITSQYYLVGDRSKIIIYTKNGDIHAVINAIGTGPEEVADMSSFYADDHSVMVMDMWKNRILEFDFSGQFLKTRELNTGHTDFVRLKGGYLFDFQQKGTNAENVLIFADINGTTVKDTIKIIGKGISYGSSKFQVREDGHILFLPSFSNTIYKIEKNNVSSLYSFDFGSHWADREECDKFVNHPSRDPFVLWNYLKMNDKIGFLRFTDTSDWIVLNFEKQEKNYNWFYNKTTEKQFMVEYEEKTANSLLEHYVMGSEDNEFVTLIPAFEYSQLPGLPKLTVSEEDNPILICYHIK